MVMYLCMQRVRVGCAAVVNEFKCGDHKRGGAVAEWYRGGKQHAHLCRCVDLVGDDLFTNLQPEQTLDCLVCELVIDELGVILRPQLYL